jgi:cytochrome c oxidase subunit IV
MTVEVRLFGLMTVFFAVAGVVYYVWSEEWAGTVLLVLSSGLAGMTGGYLFLQARLERNLSAEAGELGEAGGEHEYLPHSSPWPLELGFGSTISLVGLVLGRPVVLAGLAICAHALYGWLSQSRRRA